MLRLHAPTTGYTINRGLPTVGGPQLFAPQGGYRQDNRLPERADVLSFSGDVLADDLYVVGNPVFRTRPTTRTSMCSCG